MITITEQLKINLEFKHGRKILIISKKNLGIRGWGIKFQFLDDKYITSEVVRL